MTEFSGWQMPVQFAGLKREHHTVRQAVGLFDISHMGKFALSARDLLAALQPLVPSDLERLQPGQAQYTVLLNERAGIVDDFIFYYQGQDGSGRQQGLAIVNAATRAKDRDWLRAQLADTAVELWDRSDEQVLLALQGPQAVATLQPHADADLSALKPFGHCQTAIAGEPAFVSRTGYTGEDGFEIMLAPEAGRRLWQLLMAAGVAPCGLGARDTLRLEAALPLYGHEIAETTTPLEAGLGWLVHLERKGAFLGREALKRQKAQGVRRRLVGLQMEGRHIARHGYPVRIGDEAVGEIASGTFSPTLERAIALAYLPQASSAVGNRVAVEIRGQSHPATVVKRPFYRSPYRPA